MSNLIRVRRFASMMNASLKCPWIYAADVKSRQHFQDKIFGGIMVNAYMPPCTEFDIRQ